MQNIPREGFIVGTKEEVIYHRYLGDVRNTVPHRLEPFQVRSEGLAIVPLDGLEVPRLCRLVGEGLEVGGESAAEIIPAVDAVATEMMKLVERVLPQHD